MMSEYNYILGDSIKAVKGFDNDKFKLIITSPPYNIGKEYEVTVGCESLFISNSLDNVFEFVLQYIQRVEKLLSKGSC